MTKGSKRPIFTFQSFDNNFRIPLKHNKRKSIVMSKEDSLAAAKASTTFVEGGNLTFLDKEAKIYPW